MVNLRAKNNFCPIILIFRIKYLLLLSFSGNPKFKTK